MKDVASFTGAWVETGKAGAGIIVKMVASFTGAWVETI